ncbi:uncharacterized protein LOC111046770 [Nilaparvata lugens]|uniref:uncharacterized protein LOC111046770 n=1 Tax=Nilaparvata lugens TaxID=108931 RepID=UPI00193E7D57|nr:uncharacterized protein LOC111046770 [Nilaparvata lugens]
MSERGEESTLQEYEEDQGDHETDTTERETDPRVSWVYRLSKEEAVNYLESLGLSAVGTLTELRRRMVEHHRSRTAATSQTRRDDAIPGTSRVYSEPSLHNRVNRPTGIEPAPHRSSGTYSQGAVCDKVRSWNLRFDGVSDAPSFIERLTELQSAYGISGEQSLIALPELMERGALLWMRNRRSQWRTWADFVEAFKLRYYPHTYSDDLESQIIARKQREGEPADEYAEALLTLMRRLGSYDGDRIYQRVYQNLLPRYKLHVRSVGAQNIDQLLDITREYEAIRAEEKHSRLSSRNTKIEDNKRGENSAKATTKPRETKVIEESSTSQGPVCWNCKKTGHWRSTCPELSKCKECGKNHDQCNCKSQSKRSSGNSVIHSTKILSPRTVSGDTRTFIDVSLANQKFVALIDTGSEKSYISTQVLRALEREGSVKKENCTHKAILADGKSALLSIKVFTQLKIENISVSFQAVVMEGLKPDVLLGVSFMIQHNLTINMRHNRVEWEPEIVGAIRGSKSSANTSKVSTVAAVRPSREVGDNGVYMYVGVEGVDLNAAIDTSSQKSYVSSEIAKRLKIEGETTLPVTVCGKEYKWQVSVVPDIEPRMILGVENLRKMGAVLEMQPQGVRLRSREGEGRLSVVSEQEKFDNFLEEEIRKFSSLPGRTHILKHKIKLQEGVEPFRLRPYPRNPIMQKVIDEEVDTMLEQGVIEPSCSSWSSPIVLVKKSNGKIRFCIDFRKLNSVTHRDAYPLPNMTGILDRLRDAKYISTIDLKSGYWQVPLDEESKELTAFIVPGRGLFQFKVMPFGLHSAGATFQRLLDQVIGPKLEPYAFAYLDDVVVLGETLESHREHLAEVFQRLRDAGLIINKDKCNFLKSELKYLGHIVTEQGLRTDPETIRAVRDFPTPQRVKSLRSFLGLASWYRRFVPNFSELANPLHRLLKLKVNWQWGEEEETAFQKIKDALTCAPVLTYPHFELPFVIQTDASDEGLGAVLTQEINGEEKVIAYASRGLRGPEVRYTTTEKECLAVIYALRKFKSYVEGYEITVITDHQSLKWLHAIPHPTGRLARWVMEMQQYNLKIKYRKGKFNIVPDVLSRTPCKEELTSGETNSEGGVAPIAIGRENDDSWVKKIKSLLIADPEKFPDYTVRDGLLYRHIWPRRRLQEEQSAEGWKLCVPVSCRSEVLQQNHNAPTAGHFGIYRTYDKIARLYYWPGLFNDVATYVRRCDDCIKIKVEQRTPYGRMKNPRKLFHPWETVSTDLVGPLPRSKLGHRYIVVFQDQFTKWTEVAALSKADSAGVTKAFRELIVTRYGAPRSLICDNGTQYTSKYFRSYCEDNGVNVFFTPPYSPSCNPTERVNRVLKTMIQIFVGENHSDWDRYLREFCFAMNTTIHQGTQYTPAYLNFGRELRAPGESAFESQDDPRTQGFESSQATLQKNIKVLIQTRKIVVDNLDKAYRDASRYYNLRRRDVKLSPGQLIYKREHYLSSGVDQFAAKLAPKFSGPWKVVEILSPTVVKVKVAENKLVTVHVKDIKLLPPCVEEAEEESSSEEQANANCVGGVKCGLPMLALDGARYGRSTLFN